MSTIQDFIEEQKPENTTKKTAYDINVWKRFCSSIGEARELENISSDSLNVLLCKFFSLQSTLRKKIINTLYAGLGRSVLGKTVPSAWVRPVYGVYCVRTQDLWHSFSQYGPPGRQITYIYFSLICFYKMPRTSVRFTSSLHSWNALFGLSRFKWT